MFLPIFKILMILLTIGVTSEAFAMKYVFVERMAQGSRVFHIEVDRHIEVVRNEARKVPAPPPLNTVWDQFRSLIVAQVSAGMREGNRSLEEQIEIVSKLEWPNPVKGGDPLMISKSTIERWVINAENSIDRIGLGQNTKVPRRVQRKAKVSLHTGLNTLSLDRVPKVSASIFDSPGLSTSRIIIRSPKFRIQFDINKEDHRIAPEGNPQLKSTVNSSTFQLTVVKTSPEQFGIKLLENSPTACQRLNGQSRSSS